MQFVKEYFAIARKYRINFLSLLHYIISRMLEHCFFKEKRKKSYLHETSLEENEETLSYNHEQTLFLKFIVFIFLNFFF